jgi:hypothetical protein
MQVGRGWEMSNYAIESGGRQARLSFGCILLPELLAYTDAQDHGLPQKSRARYLPTGRT